MADTISWIATVATIIAASMTAANLGSRITGYGFCVFLFGSLCWVANGLMTGQAALTWTNVVLTALNIFGIWRWLGRQTRIEEGAASAAQASEHTPGEALFPVSLLSKVQLEDQAGNRLGVCVDAMAGCSSGRLQYIVASEGGVAGMGEVLRRVPWNEARVSEDKVVSNLNSADFSRLEKIQRDQWPAR
jgi:hypothetical protein